MFGKAKIENSNVWKSQNSEFQCLENQNPEFQLCWKKPKYRIPMFGKAKIQNSKVWKGENTELDVWKFQNTAFQCLEMPKY